MAFENGYALLVGVGEYAEPRLDTARITAGDARLMGDVLQSPIAGYPPGQVRVLTGSDACRSSVLSALRDLASATNAQSTVVLLISGHGMSAPDGGYYFLTHDARYETSDTFNPFTVISNQELIRAVRQIPAQKMLILLNTCFSGVVAGDFSAPAPTVLGSKPPPDAVTDQVLSAGEGRVIITACRPTQKSWFDTHAEATVFVEALVDGLRGSEGVSNRDGYIGVFELYEYVFHEVQKRVDNIPRAGKQDPVLTIRAGVGPFPVALYKGGQGLRPDAAFVLNEKPSVDGSAVRIVPEVDPDIIQASNSGIANAVGLGNNIVGVGNQWSIGSISGKRDVNLGNTFNEQQYGGIRFGDNAQIGGGGTVIGGNVSGSVFSGTFQGDVSQAMSGQYIASPRYKGTVVTLDGIFAEAMQRSLKLPDDDQQLARPIVMQARNQAEKLQYGGVGLEMEKSFENRLRSLVAVAPDVAGVILSGLSSPAAVGISSVLQNIAARVKG